MASPSVLSDDFGAVLTTTLRTMQPTLRDNISRGSKWYNWLNENGRFRTVDGGERIQVPIMYGLNSTADVYSGYGLLNTLPQDGITSAFYEWTQLSVSISISRKEERQNSGRARAISLLQSKTMQAENSIKELLNNCLMAGRIAASANLGQFFQRRGTIDASAVGPYPMAALVDANPSRSVSIGNINGNTYAFWRNVANASSATTFQGMRKEMTNTYNNCTKGVMGNPDVMISDQIAWEEYWAGLDTKERYIVTDARTIDILGGSEAFKFRGATYFWDEVVPDVETNAEVVDGVGTVSTSNIFFLNSQSWEIVVDAETDFMTTPFVREVSHWNIRDFRDEEPILMTPVLSHQTDGALALAA